MILTAAIGRINRYCGCWGNRRRCWIYPWASIGEHSIKMADQEDTKPKHGKLFVTSCLIGNIILSISIVMLNKTVYTYYGFPNVSMTCLHFVFTTIGMVICRAFGIFHPKPLPLTKMIPISMTFCGFVVFTNLSLQYNTVGTYQIIKTMTMPCIMIIQIMYYSRTFSSKVRLTIVS